MIGDEIADEEERPWQPSRSTSADSFSVSALTVSHALSTLASPTLPHAHFPSDVPITRSSMINLDVILLSRVSPLIYHGIACTAVFGGVSRCHLGVATHTRKHLRTATLRLDVPLLSRTPRRPLSPVAPILRLRFVEFSQLSGHRSCATWTLRAALPFISNAFEHDNFESKLRLHVSLTFYSAPSNPLKL